MTQVIQLEVPENPNYFGILPANVRYNKNISPSAKILYSEFTALTNKEGYCWATNSYFAKLYQVDDKTVSKWVSELVKEKVIHIKVEKNYIRKIFTIPFNEKLTGVPQKADTPLPQKADTPLPQKADNNNTSINNTINNKINRNFKKLSTISFCKTCRNSGLVTLMKNNVEYSFSCDCEHGNNHNNKKMSYGLKHGYSLQDFEN